MTPSWQRLVPLLRCPACDGALSIDEANAFDGVLIHREGSCGETYPVVQGIPRLLLGVARSGVARAYPELVRDRRFSHWSTVDRAAGPDLQLVTRFDREWERFSAMPPVERARVFDMYFDVVPSEILKPGILVLDAGCGSGRWAREVAARGPYVVAVDLGRSVELARRNTSPAEVGVVQADVRDLPVATASFDVAYSLGVLHHLDETEVALGRIVHSVKPGGLVLIYLYYALDGRGPAFRAAFAAVDVMRRGISRLPASVALAFSAVIAALIYWPFARSALVLQRVGLGAFAQMLPLRVYSTLSFRTMRNDSLDRFGTRLEKRFSRRQIASLMTRAGLEDIVISSNPPFWHAVGRKRR